MFGTWVSGSGFGVERKKIYLEYALMRGALRPPGTWRFMGSYKWYKSPNMASNYSYPTYISTQNFP